MRKNWLPPVLAPAFAMANTPGAYCSPPRSSSGIEYPGPPLPVPVGSPPCRTSIDVSMRVKYWPSKKWWFARNTKLFTVCGAVFASSSMTMVPHEVSIVAT